MKKTLRRRIEEFTLMAILDTLKTRGHVNVPDLEVGSLSDVELTESITQLRDLLRSINE